MTIKTAPEARAGGTVAALARSGPGLLAALAATLGRVFSRREPVARVHGHDHERTADVHVKNPRARPGGDLKAPRLIKTVTGGCTLGGGPDG